MSEQPEREQPRAEPAVEPLLVRVEEAARILSLSRSTIYEMMDAGELPSIRRGTARRIPVAALREWVARQTAPSSVRRPHHPVRPGGAPACAQPGREVGARHPQRRPGH